MFEKSLYELIRGLRNHRGGEKEYIQESLYECRKEIKSQDMDLKATALLKLTYLEMFGHDMSWASFNVLEVMSSSKYLQKRVGYLGAVQSYRPDTEVLMLAENLLKKDLTSPLLPTISLPLVAIPHVISSSMANSLLSDLLPRITHSHPAIRKKSIATLYRLALVYPETLRPAWPKIKERLQDNEEDSSVTAAVINVVCELGWRRPQDFLPLAPRLFDLLVDGQNNWMAIKIIKLFATLTPLEPRLVKKLLPPLTNIIKTTPAMSLLYECINGIIQGGIFQSVEGTKEGDEIAQLCVGKLRGMLVIEGDPNLKYVALLAFNKIVESHPYLVSLHEDVIMSCIDDADISIRLRALDLVVGMVNAQNLVSVVETLLRQLRDAPFATSADDPVNDRAVHSGVAPAADNEGDDVEESIRPNEKKSSPPAPLPDEFRVSIIRRILEMCSSSIYTNISDFDWYIGVLTQLVKFVPSVSSTLVDNHSTSGGINGTNQRQNDVAFEIGCELRNIATRVKSSRQEATRAAESLASLELREQMFTVVGNGWQGILEPSIWVVGEFAHLLADADGALGSILHSTTSQLPARTVSVSIQAAVKVLAFITSSDRQAWSTERKTRSALLIARVVHFLEPLTSHPDLEVQERAVEYLELVRLVTEAVNTHDTASYDGHAVEAPLLLTQVMPGLFTGTELNPVARTAQKKVPVPDELDLDKPINENLPNALHVPDLDCFVLEEDEFLHFYRQRPESVSSAPAAANRLDVAEAEVSYQQSNGDMLDGEAAARRKAGQQERYKDDPFYIPNENKSGVSTPLHNILRASNGVALDIDSIPVMELNLESGNADSALTQSSGRQPVSRKKKLRRNFDILGDENIDEGDSATLDQASSVSQSRGRSSLLQVDSTGLASLSLESDNRATQLQVEKREAEDAEMAKAMQEVERLRLEMQRASERIQPTNGPLEGTVVKMKKKKKKREVDLTGPDASGIAADKVTLKKKKKKVMKDPASVQTTAEAHVSQPELAAVGTANVPETLEPLTTKKKNKRRQVTFEELGET